MPQTTPKVSCTPTPAAKLRTRKSESSTSGEPSLRVLIRSYRDEERQDQRRAGHRDEAPQRPARLPSLGQAVEQHQQTEAGQRHADQVQAQRLRGPGLDDVAVAEQQTGDADRRLIRKIGRQLQAEQVPLRQQGAEQRAGDRAQADHRTEEPEDLAPLVSREGDVDDREHLRDHRRGGGALQDPGGDQDGRVAGEAAERRGEGEAGDADQEDPLAAVDVAETPAGDQADHAKASA